MEDKNLPREAMALIGVEKQRQYTVTEKDIRHFAQAIGDSNPLYHDSEYGKRTKYGSMVAPPLFCHAFAFEDVAPEALPPDGSPVEADIPIPAKRMVGGGSVFESYIRFRPGDQVRVRTLLKDLYTKTGRSGVLYFIVIETCFYNQKDELAAKETATFIKRI